MEKLYSATEVAKKLGISSKKVGMIAKEKNLQNENIYGEFFKDKLELPLENGKKYIKEIQTFKYNEKGLEEIRKYIKEIEIRMKTEEIEKKREKSKKQKGIEK